MPVKKPAKVATKKSTTLTSLTAVKKLLQAEIKLQEGNQPKEVKTMRAKVEAMEAKIEALLDQIYNLETDLFPLENKLSEMENEHVGPLVYLLSEVEAAESGYAG